MNELQWQSWFEIGHERIDCEHRVFLNLINNFATSVSLSDDRDKISRSLTELRKYAEFHFVSEENIMIECDYDDIAAHRIYHRNILKDLDGYITSLENGGRSLPMLVTFLFEWFVTHTVSEDIKISAKFKSMKLAEFKKINS